MFYSANFLTYIVGCPEGHYIPRGENGCHPCPPGSYGSRVYDDCYPCYAGTTNTIEGATDRSSCTSMYATTPWNRGRAGLLQLQKCSDLNSFFWIKFLLNEITHFDLQ